MRTVLSAYFQPHESEEIRASQLAWWCDELQDWHREQIVWALRKWNREHPRHRPTPGDIATICKAERGRRHAEAVKLAASVCEPERERVSPDAAAEILRAAGVGVKRP